MYFDSGHGVWEHFAAQMDENLVIYGFYVAEQYNSVVKTFCMLSNSLN